MKDISGSQITVGDWIFYAVKESTSVSYSFAKVLEVTEYMDWGKIKPALKVQPYKMHYKDGWYKGRIARITNTPLRVTVNNVPYEILKEDSNAV